MKNIYIIFTFIFLLSTAQSWSQKFDTAVEYLNFVSDEQVTITKNMWRYTQAIAHSKNDRSVANKKSSLIKSLERAILKIKKADSYQEDDYKQYVLKNMSINKSMLEEDYENIVDMKEISKRSYDDMEAYIMAREMADKKMADAQQDYEDHFYSYAEKYGIDIIENETDLGKKMIIAGKVFDHYNEMYLIFFKVNINEIYLWQAVEKNDIGAIQQNTNALNQAAKEGKELLKNVSLYKNDASLVKSTNAIFDHYINETENILPQILDFLILNEEFEAINSSFEKTPEKKRTKKQVNTYNRKVNELNKAVKNYNKITKTLNIESQKVINQFNLSNEKFLSKHIPKDS